MTFIGAIFLMAALGPAIALADGPPTCAKVPEALYGISLGPVHDYPGGLRNDLRREGTAEFIADLGFESVEGEAGGIAYPRIMVWFDRGQFIGATAFGRIATVKDHGFARIASLVGTAANSLPVLANGKATFVCEGSMELSVEPGKWDDGPVVEVRVMDADALKKSNTYFDEYCADPTRRRAQDGCKE